MCMFFSVLAVFGNPVANIEDDLNNDYNQIKDAYQQKEAEDWVKAHV